MTPANFFANVLLPASRSFGFHNSEQSRVLLMAIAGQESNWTARIQVKGPAHSYWQFEITAIRALSTNPVTSALFRAACNAWDVADDVTVIHQAVAWHDPLAYVAARLLLWADPAPLPATTDVNEGWTCYNRVWRPGTPRPEFWAACHAQATAEAWI